MKYRDATIADAAAISQLVSMLASEYIAPSLGVGGIGRLLESMGPDATSRRILDGWTHLCGVADDELAAILVVKPPSHLYHLFVRSASQGTGIARRLFEIADQRIRENAGCRITTVNSSMNAIGVYERLGFAVEGTVVDAEGVRFQPMARR